MRPAGLPPAVEARQQTYLRTTSPEDRIRRLHLMLAAQAVLFIVVALGMALNVWLNHLGAAAWVILAPMAVGLAALFVYAHRRLGVIEAGIRGGRM